MIDIYIYNYIYRLSTDHDKRFLSKTQLLMINQLQDVSTQNLKVATFVNCAYRIRSEVSYSVYICS